MTASDMDPHTFIHCFVLLIIISLHIFHLSLFIPLMRCAAHQWEVVGIDPDDAELRKLSVFSGNLLQDLQELITIWKTCVHNNNLFTPFMLLSTNQNKI